MILLLPGLSGRAGRGRRRRCVVALVIHRDGLPVFVDVEAYFDPALQPKRGAPRVPVPPGRLGRWRGRQRRGRRLVPLRSRRLRRRVRSGSRQRREAHHAADHRQARVGALFVRIFVRVFVRVAREFRGRRRRRLVLRSWKQIKR